MIVPTLKPHAIRSFVRFQTSAVAPRPTWSLSSKKPVSAPSADPTYLRRWVAHQATTYNELLKTIAAAPPAPGKRG